MSNTTFKSNNFRFSVQKAFHDMADAICLTELEDLRVKDLSVFFSESVEEDNVVNESTQGRAVVCKIELHHSGPGNNDMASLRQGFRALILQMLKELTDQYELLTFEHLSVSGSSDSPYISVRLSVENGAQL